MLRILSELVALWTTLSLLRNILFTLWERPFEVTLLSCLIAITEPHYQVEVTSPSYSGGAGFEYQPEDTCPHWDFHGFFQIPEGKCCDEIRFMPWPFPSASFTIQHYWSSHTVTLMFLSEWRYFPSAPCLAGWGGGTWCQLESPCCWNRTLCLTRFLPASVTRKYLQFGTWTDPLFPTTLSIASYDIGK